MSQAILYFISDKGYPGVIANLHVSNRFVQEDYKDKKEDDDDYFYYSKYMDIYYCVYEKTLKLPTWEIPICEYGLRYVAFDDAGCTPSVQVGQIGNCFFCTKSN